MNDWNGNSRSAFAMMGARNFAKEEREQHDYYATEPKATRLLLERERFTPLVWEPACGEGHMAKVLEEYGYKVYASDLIDRGYGNVLDFLACSTPPPVRNGRYCHKPAVQVRAGVCKTRAGTAAGGRTCGVLSETAIP